jgi:hypothetical protein
MSQTAIVVVVVVVIVVVESRGGGYEDVGLKMPEEVDRVD